MVSETILLSIFPLLENTSLLLKYTVRTHKRQGSRKIMAICVYVYAWERDFISNYYLLIFYIFIKTVLFYFRKSWNTHLKNITTMRKWKLLYTNWHTYWIITTPYQRCAYATISSVKRFRKGQNNSIHNANKIIISPHKITCKVAYRYNNEFFAI